MNKEYKLDVPPTSKDLILQPPMALNGVLPKINFNMIIVGSPGSGKSVLCYNIINKFYQDFFDIVILISPTGESDDIQKALNLPSARVITDMTKAEEVLNKIIKVQKEEIKKNNESYDGVNKVLIWFDDIIGHQKFMKSDALVETIIKNRHINASTILCSQYYKAIPKRIRECANCDMFFNCSRTELETIADDFEPPGLNKQRFMDVLEANLKEKHAFITINRRSPWNERIRKGLAQVIDFNAAIPDKRKDVYENTVNNKKLKTDNFEKDVVLK